MILVLPCSALDIASQGFYVLLLLFLCGSELRIWHRETLIQMLTRLFREEIAYAPHGRAHLVKLRLDFFHNSDNLYDFSATTGEIIVKTTDSKEKKDVLECLDLSGLLNLNTTFMPRLTAPSLKSKQTKNQGWAQWFLQAISEPEKLFIIPDTNILMRHYCSKILFRKLGEKNFGRLQFRIPRLDILEIERKVNQSKRGTKEKRVALYATREIMFLREHRAELLEPFDVSLLTSFPEKAGTKFVDAWIRREIHDFIRMKSKVYAGNVLFLTCDLMNALAAHAEGLRTCYFSRTDQERHFVEASVGNAEELADLIINSSIIFGQVRMDVYLIKDTLHRSLQLEGMWSGKTPYHWSNDSIRVSDLP